MIILIILILLLFLGLRKGKNSHKRKIENEKARKECYCYFNEGISIDDFQGYAFDAIRNIKREIYINFNGAEICGEVTSQSGLSKWYFIVDFNDYGHLTGRYWIYSDNCDSSIPNVIANYVSERIIGRYHEINLM